MSQTTGPTPGADRVFSLNVNGHTLTGRRPSRGDDAEIRRLYAQKLLRAAPPMADTLTAQQAQALVESLDGNSLFAEAQIEVLFRPRARQGVDMNLGEQLPQHWLRTVKDAEGNPLGQVPSFDQVPSEEFDEAVRQLDEAMAQKKLRRPDSDVVLYRFCTRHDQRLAWKTWQQFPDTRPWADLDDLDDDEFAWVAMQGQIDDGLLYCEPCDAFGRNTYCGQCGERFIGRELDWRTCPQCKINIPTPFCSLCGYDVLSEVLKKWEDGDVDLDAEEEHAAGELAKMVAKHEALQFVLFDPEAGSEEPPDAVSLAHMLNQGFGRGARAGRA